jgi:hypothetical protein
LKIQGRCHCGTICYEAEVEPVSVNICHCLDCQRLSGSAFRAGIVVTADRFRLLEGKPREYVKVADSGAKRVHAFCETCGSPVYSCAAETPLSYTLRVGALEQSHMLGRPARQIWTKRRLPWMPPLGGVQEFEGQPAYLDGDKANRAQAR